MYVNNEAIQLARNADLHAFLLANHSDLFEKDGKSIRLVSNRSISIKEGFHAYRDFSTGECGNSITFLMEHLGYAFQDAVMALCGQMHPTGGGTAARLHAPAEYRAVSLPPAAPLPHKRMYAFLMARGIPKAAIDGLVSHGLVYQSEGANNVVFVNRERDYCELRGTYTFAKKPFHGCRKARADRFWYFLPGDEKPETAFITEGAIDAISLCLLHRRAGRNVSKSVYISIGGVDNHPAINRIKCRIHTILAVDNDRAGELCRQRHNELECIIPVNKDWNDDLRKLPAGQQPGGK